MKKIQAIQVKTSYLVNSVIAGEYESAFKGRGMEFSEVREYTPGDDVRLIDWNVTARAGHPFVKEFREERELTVILMVDVSSSGEFGSSDRLKNEASAEIASILAFSAIRNNDKIGLIVFSDIIEHYIPPKKGKAHIWNIIRTILNFTPEGRKTDLGLPLQYLLNIQKRKTVAFLISDFQAGGYEKVLKFAKQKHDIIAIAITDPREHALPANIGRVHLEDTETGESIFVDTSDPKVLERFHSIRNEEKVSRDKLFRSAGLDIVEVSTDQSLIDPIIRFFKMREKKH
ncbi:MAG: DUF58 domain-containing protein [Nitrospinota bacterium]|nr:DUF58 domain-containing protein [Nitrospinota bacterium]